MQWSPPPFICKTLKSVGRYPLIRKIMIYGQPLPALHRHTMQCDAMWNPDSRMTWTLPRTCIESYPGGKGGVSPTLCVRNWGLSEPCRILGISRKNLTHRISWQEMVRWRVTYTLEGTNSPLKMFETAVEEIRQDNLAAKRQISWEAASHNLRASCIPLLKTLSVDFYRT